jgi:RNA polymerase sigma factor (sigma-70 family)
VVSGLEGLLTRRRGGLTDAEAAEFGEFYRVSHAATFLRAYRVSGGRAEMAKDAVQEAYLRAMERWGTLRHLHERQQRAWLGRAVANILMDAWRSASRAPAFVGLDSVDADPRAVVPPPDAGHVELQLWYRQVCVAAATQLSGKRRAAFALHYLAGYEIAEVAEMLGTTSTTVRVHLSTGRRKLMTDAPALAAIRDALRQEEVT